jgi:hypothetical protein
LNEGNPQITLIDADFYFRHLRQSADSNLGEEKIALSDLRAVLDWVHKP